MHNAWWGGALHVLRCPPPCSVIEQFVKSIFKAIQKVEKRSTCARIIRKGLELLKLWLCSCKFHELLDDSRQNERLDISLFLKSPIGNVPPQRPIQVESMNSPHQSRKCSVVHLHPQQQIDQFHHSESGKQGIPEFAASDESSCSPQSPISCDKDRPEATGMVPPEPSKL